MPFTRATAFYLKMPSLQNFAPTMALFSSGQLPKSLKKWVIKFRPAKPWLPQVFRWYPEQPRPFSRKMKPLKRSKPLGCRWWLKHRPEVVVKACAWSKKLRTSFLQSGRPVPKRLPRLATMPFTLKNMSYRHTTLNFRCWEMNMAMWFICLSVSVLSSAGIRRWLKKRHRSWWPLSYANKWENMP